MLYYLGYGCSCEIDKEGLPFSQNKFCKCSNHFERKIIKPELNINKINDVEIVDKVINLPIHNCITSKVILHANVIDIAGKYIALIGDSCIGKTLLTINSINQTNYCIKFVTDDLTMINKDGSVVPCCCRPLLIRGQNDAKYVRSSDIFNMNNISNDLKKIVCIVSLYTTYEKKSKIELLIKNTWNVTAQNLRILMKIPFITSPMIIDNLEKTICIMMKNLTSVGVL